MMEYQNNNGNYDKRNRRKAKKRKLLFYRAACVILCLLIVSVIFGVVHFLGESKDPGLLSKENTKTDKNYSWLTDDQNEAVPSVPEPAISYQANKI